jgi:protein-S-isoprenylcysteine O-methyltransferase Ste14
MTLAGFICAIAGAAVISFYTIANYQFRRLGISAAWWGGWVLGSLGMALTGAAWILLGLAGPHYPEPTLRIFGLMLAACGAVLYFSSAAYVGRIRARHTFHLGLHTFGIYRLVRHPQALALALTAIGLALTTMSRPFLLGLPFLAGFWIAYTYLEERFELIPAFGQEYRDYIRHTGRLLPSVKSLQSLHTAFRTKSFEQ